MDLHKSVLLALFFIAAVSTSPIPENLSHIQDIRNSIDSEARTLFDLTPTTANEEQFESFLEQMGKAILISMETGGNLKHSADGKAISHLLTEKLLDTLKVNELETRKFVTPLIIDVAGILLKIITN